MTELKPTESLEISILRILAVNVFLVVSMRCILLLLQRLRIV